jgi:hypothetical protein
MSEQHTTEENTSFEAVVKYTKLFITGFKFEANQPGQLYNLLTILDGYGDIRCVNLRNSDEDFIICNVPDDKVYYLDNRLKDRELTISAPKNSDNSLTLSPDQEIYHQPEIIDTTAILFSLTNEEEVNGKVELTLNIPDIPGSLSEFLWRFTQVQIDLDSLHVQVNNDGKSGTAIVKFENYDKLEMIKTSLTEPKIIKMNVLSDELKINLTEAEFLNLKMLALYQAEQNRPIPPTVDEYLIKKLGTDTINSIILEIRTSYSSVI